MTTKTLTFGELSMYQVQAILNSQVTERFGNKGKDLYPWIREMYHAYIVFDLAGKQWKIAYSMVDGEPKISADAAEEVTQEYVNVKNGDVLFSDFGGKFIEIFRAGDYGDKGKYTTEDLKTLAENYDPAKHEAPAVVGHPTTDAPAMGWVKALKVSGEKLLAKFHQVPDKFEQAVKDGRFKKRSVAFTRDASGAVTLRHVGFLGAMPPEVKGLADVKFGEGEFHEIQFTEDDGMDATETKKTFLEALREVFGKDAKVFTEAEHKTAIDTAVAGATKPLQDKITAFEAADAQRTEASKTFAEKAKAFVDKLKADHKWIPAFDKMGVPALFAELAKTGATVTFGEGDKATQKGAAEIFADFLCGLQEIVPVGDLTKGAQGAKKGGKVLNFAETNGVALDMQSVEFSEACNARATEKKISFGDAMKELRSEGWKPSTAAAGAV